MSENIKKVESVEQPKAKTTTKGKGKKAPASEQKAKATQEQLKKALESVGVTIAVKGSFPKPTNAMSWGTAIFCSFNTCKAPKAA